MTDFERLFNEKREYVFRFLLKMTHDASLSEELTQETFFRAYMNYASLRDKDRVTAWLCQIAKNAYFAWYNAQNREQPLDRAEQLSDGESAEDICIRRELSEKALRCLHALEEPYREVFMLSVFGGFPLKDISAIFGKSESWARVTLYRAKQKLSEGMR